MQNQDADLFILYHHQILNNFSIELKCMINIKVFIAIDKDTYYIR